jgi:F-type H+-transporting ATPase subunit b
MLAALIALTVATGEAAQDVTQAVEKKGGLPQLNPHDFAPQLIWLVITFVLLFMIMKWVALPRIGDVLDERRDRVQRDLDAAERFKQETEKALAEYEKALGNARASAMGMAREAHEKLNSEVENERAKVDEQIGTKLAEAESRIAATKSQALASVNEIAADTVSAIVAKLLGENVSANEVKRALEPGAGE